MRRVDIKSLARQPLSHDAGITKHVIFPKGTIPHLCQLAQARIPSGVRVTLHKHSDMHEIFMVLSGCGQIHCNGQTQKVGPGICIHIEPGELHGFENEGDEDLVVMYFGVAE